MTTVYPQTIAKEFQIYGEEEKQDGSDLVPKVMRLTRAETREYLEVKVAESFGTMAIQPG